jgi:hypothetical protein
MGSKKDVSMNNTIRVWVSEFYTWLVYISHIFGALDTDI